MADEVGAGGGVGGAEAGMPPPPRRPHRSVSTLKVEATAEARSDLKEWLKEWPSIVTQMDTLTTNLKRRYECFSAASLPVGCFWRPPRHAQGYG